MSIALLSRITEIELAIPSVNRQEWYINFVGAHSIVVVQLGEVQVLLVTLLLKVVSAWVR